MRPFRDVPIRHKLTVAFLVATIIPLLTGMGLLLAYERAGQRERIVEYLTAQAEMIAVSTRASLDFNDPARAAETLAVLRFRPMIVAAGLYAPDGRVFARYVRAEAGTFDFSAPRPAGHYRLGKHLDVFQPVMSDGEVSGTVFLRADLRALDARYNRYALTLGGALLGLAGLSFALSRLLQAYITRPLLALAGAAQQVQASQDYSIRAQTFGQDEIGGLTRALNRMLGGIEERDASLHALNQNLGTEVAERQHAEEETRQRALELAAANKELEAFAYSVSHDLRAPLRSIDGFSRILLEDYAPRLDEDGRDSIARIRAATQRMAQLIDDLLNLSRVTRAELVREPVDLSAIARSVAGELQRNESSRAVELVVAEGLRAHGDAHLLRIVLENLLGNAWKFTGRRDRARIEFGAVEREGLTEYFVRDNGAGFDPAYAAKLFGAFQRLHASAEFPGTGVGLATVQRIVRRHGGNVRATGEVGAGATFFFTLGPTTPSHLPVP